MPALAIAHAQTSILVRSTPILSPPIIDVQKEVLTRLARLSIASELTDPQRFAVSRGGSAILVSGRPTKELFNVKAR